MTDQEAKTRLEQYGRNQLSPPKRIHPVLQFLRYFLDLFNVMLWVAGVIAYIIYAIDPPNNFANVYIGGILLGVCVMNAFIEFYQSRKSQAILASFMVFIRLIRI